MQETLQNTHYKKIWEKVIMNRHPEAESLNLALGSEYLQYEEECITITDIIIKEILGRPITLTDILQLLYKPKSDCLPEIKLMSTDFWEWVGLQKGLYVSIHANEAYGWQKLFIWNITADVLEDQTPETWEKISNLI